MFILLNLAAAANTSETSLPVPAPATCFPSARMSGALRDSGTIEVLETELLCIISERGKCGHVPHADAMRLLEWSGVK